MTLTFLTTDTLGKHVCRFGCTPVVLPGYFVWNLVVLWGVLTNLYDGLLRASAGGSMSFTASYTAPHAVTEVGGLGEFRIDYLPNPRFELGRSSSRSSFRPAPRSRRLRPASSWMGTRSDMRGRRRRPKPSGSDTVVDRRITKARMTTSYAEERWSCEVR